MLFSAIRLLMWCIRLSVSRFYIDNYIKSFFPFLMLYMYSFWFGVSQGSLLKAVLWPIQKISTFHTVWLGLSVILFALTRTSNVLYYLSQYKIYIILYIVFSYEMVCIRTIGRLPPLEEFSPCVEDLLVALGCFFTLLLGCPFDLFKVFFIILTFITSESVDKTFDNNYAQSIFETTVVHSNDMSYK